MLRLVKFNLYNYKLYKEMMFQWKENSSFTDKENLFLLANQFSDHDTIVKFFLNQDKLSRANDKPSLTYFLFDTVSNSFIGYLNLQLKHNNDVSDVYFSISPLNINKGYGSEILRLFLVIAKEKNIKNLSCIVQNNNIKAIKIFEKYSANFEKHSFSSNLVFELKNI